MSNPPDMVTISGHEIFYDAPERYTVDWNDIETATKNICRYAGHLKWELVRHSLLTARLVKMFTGSDIGAAYAGIHDFHEIIVTDVIHGMKRHIPKYQNIEHEFEVEFHKQLELPWEHRPHEDVKFSDVRALVIEMETLGHPSAKAVASRYGGLVNFAEAHIMKAIQEQSLDECWIDLRSIITEGQNQLREAHGKRKD